MSRARAPVAFGGGSEARARRSRYVSRVLAGTRGRARVRGLLRTRFATSTASSSAFDALNTFGAIPRGARRAMDSEVGGQRDPTPKTARERAQSPRRGARVVMLMSSAYRQSLLYRPSLLVTRVKWMLWYLAGGQ